MIDRKVRMGVWKLLLVLLTFVCIDVDLSAQNFRKDGDKAWDAGRYKTAVNKYGKVKSLKADKKLLAKRGLGFFKLNRLSEAIEHFTLSKKLGNNDPDLYLLMAQSKQHLDQYDEAAYFYKEYIKERGDKGAQSQLALREMKNCIYSATNQIRDASGVMHNLGSEVNTYYDEIYAVQSPRFGNVYYFTSNRNLKDMEVFSYAIDEKGVWKQNENFGEGINSDDDQYVMDVSADGECLLFVTGKAEDSSKRIYVSTFDDKEQQHFIQLPDYIVDGATDVQIIDHNSVAFSSNQLGGYGGYDIYLIDYQNGVWSDPKNAGDKINTSYNERSPYYAATGDYLYYSSDKPYCYGGYDIYYYNTLSISAEPYNMGKPINSSGNDLMFRLQEDGQTAVMSSDRKSGEGAYDLYQVYMTLPKPMPPRSKKQLTYVRDYFDRLNPQAEVAEEEKKTHLEKLKERLALDEKEEKEAAQKKEELEADAEEVDVAVVEPEEQKKVEESETKEIAVDEVSEPTMEDVTENTTEDTIEDTTEADEKSSVLVGLLKAKDRIDSKEADEDKMDGPEKETEIDSQEKVSTQPVAVQEPEVEEPEPVVEEEPKPTKSGEAIAEVGNSSKGTKSSTTTNIPQKATDESPLETIRTDSKEIEASTTVQDIRGEKISNALLYQDRQDLMNPLNKEKIDKLKTYLRSNPQHSVHIVSHTDHLEPGLPEFMQYNTLKRANLVARYLMENGVARDNISIESVSANYPLVKPVVSGQLNREYLGYNKRIEFEILDEDNTILASHNINDSKIPGFALDRKYELYTQVREELYYSVEIAKSEHIFKNAVLRLYDDIYIRKNTPTSKNLYYIGVFNKYEEVLALQQELANSSAPYAEIKVFYQGQPVSKSDLKLLAKDYPDLNAYLAGQE